MVWNLQSACRNRWSASAEWANPTPGTPSSKANGLGRLESPTSRLSGVAKMARIPARNRLKSYRTARSALLAVGPYLIPSWHNRGKDGTEWRESQASSHAPGSGQSSGARRSDKAPGQLSSRGAGGGRLPRARIWDPRLGTRIQGRMRNRGVVDDQRQGSSCAASGPFPAPNPPCESRAASIRRATTVLRFPAVHPSLPQQPVQTPRLSAITALSLRRDASHRHFHCPRFATRPRGHRLRSLTNSLVQRPSLPQSSSGPSASATLARPFPVPYRHALDECSPRLGRTATF